LNDVGALTHRPLAEARLLWPEVRAELERVRVRYGESWIPDDMWHEIALGVASLHAAGEPGALEAFVILQVATRVYDRSLHIWSAAEQTTARAADYWPQIMAIAADNNCTRVTIETPRRWERVLPGANVRYLYSFNVEGGPGHVGGQHPETD
jgi:hypothetical protein